MQTGDKVWAKFQPVRTDDLRPGVEEWIGRVLHWRALYPIEPEDGGSYVGDWAMMPDDMTFPAAWIPSRDLRVEWTGKK